MMEGVVSTQKLRCQDVQLKTWSSFHLIVTSPTQYTGISHVNW